MSTDVSLPAQQPGARWLLAASWGTGLLCLTLIGVSLWEGPHPGVIGVGAAGAGLSLLSVARLKRRSASPLLVVAAVGCMLLALWLRQDHLARSWQAAVREATQRASIDEFEAQVQALIERQRVELEALKADAGKWDEATRERVRTLEANFAAAARDAEQLIINQRRQLDEGSAASTRRREP